jgi:diaminopimelate decarboxylase
MPEPLLVPGNLTSEDVVSIARDFGTPVYVYDLEMILDRCKRVKGMPHAFGLFPRFAMKALPTRAILQIMMGQGFGIDAGSMNEVRRACEAGHRIKNIMLTTQEVPVDRDRAELQRMMEHGLVYNVCSLTQLAEIAGFAGSKRIPLSMRVNPGVGSGETGTRNTGDKYAPFGVHLGDLGQALQMARDRGVIFSGVHDHIGSGGDPEKWKENIDTLLGVVERYFPDATTVNFGGGFREGRMPGEVQADVHELGLYAKERIEAFASRTGRKLRMEVEPGTFLVANSGFIITKVMDYKRTGADGPKFLVLDGGMEVNTRPLLYGSQHPVYIVSPDGELRSSEFRVPDRGILRSLVLAGRCCESGDCQTLDKEHNIVSRLMAPAKIGDYVVIGGAGAYCSSMSPHDYLSHQQAPEVLLTSRGRWQVIREKQARHQITQNERGL